MRIAKTVTLIIALAFGALALQLISPTKVQAADALEGTRWADGDTVLMFFKDGVVDLDWGFCCPVSGKYRLSGSSLEITFEDKERATATISGNKMSLQMIREDGSAGDKYVLTRQKQ